MKVFLCTDSANENIEKVTEKRNWEVGSILDREHAQNVCWLRKYFMKLVLEDCAKETVWLNLYIKQLCPHHVHTAVSTSCPQIATKQKNIKNKIAAFACLWDNLGLQTHEHYETHWILWTVTFSGCILEKSAVNAIFLLLTHKAWFLLTVYVNSQKNMLVCKLHVNPWNAITWYLKFIYGALWVQLWLLY